MLELRYYGDSVLRKTAARIDVFDGELAAFAQELAEAMRREDGVGLAAPQVGVSRRLVVIDASGGAEDEPYILINPEITESTREVEEGDEGCLSLPGINLNVSRPARVSVRAQNERGEEYEIKDASGLLARALQHEIDHLNGILFIDHVSAAQRILLKPRLKKIAQGEFDDYD